MSRTTAGLDDKLRAFLQATSIGREDAVLTRLREETAPLEMARMQISVEQGRLMALLAQSIGAHRALEVGTFTGYSALCVARVLPENGKLVACDVSEEWTSIARRAWAEAGVADRIDLRLAPANDTLDALRAAGEDGTYDFAFIDADKEAYDGYYERCLALLRPGGLMTIDNVFLSGRVVDVETEDPAAAVVRALSYKISADPRVDPALVPIGDGLWIVRKR